MNQENLEKLLNRAYRYALSLTHSQDDAFDLVQNAYLKILEKEKPLLISYFFPTIRNLFIDNKRREKLQFNLSSKLFQEDIQEPIFTTEPYLEKIISQLPSRNREIIFLSIVEEYTAKEIATLMDIPRGTILSVLHRTKEKLKEQLREKSH